MQQSKRPVYVGILMSPVLWGLVVTAFFYGLIFGGILKSAVISRYFTDSGLEYIETGMFFIGLCVLLFRWGNVAFQQKWMRQQEQAPETFLGAVPSGGNLPSDAAAMIDKIRQLPAKFLEGYFFQRLRNALDYIVRSNSAEGFEDELKYLADLDAAKMSQGYSFARVIIWAIPILGFLGTVMGITIAIGELGGNLSDTESTLPKMIAGLSVAFDTTALALGFSIVLMFLQFFVERAENGLLDRVDYQVHRELAGRFMQVSESPEGILAAMRSLCETMLEGFDKQARRQAAEWETAFRQVDVEWGRRMEALAPQVAESFHTAIMAKSDQWLAGPSEQLKRIAEALFAINNMEKVLSNNVSTLQGARNFEKTVADLAGAVATLKQWLESVRASRK
ncbi:MAG: MotA/TolQ/ExbB proton channel family protein [Planctomycetia bacterium]|nr:MotA/TolQ/ExbB proton channel family protein [Planctomycetia bacterium]